MIGCLREVGEPVSNLGEEHSAQRIAFQAELKSISLAPRVLLDLLKMQQNWTGGNKR